MVTINGLDDNIHRNLLLAPPVNGFLEALDKGVAQNDAFHIPLSSSFAATSRTNLLRPEAEIEILG